MLSDELKRLKKEKQQTTAEIAAAAGIPVQTLEKLLCGETTNPKYKTLKLLADYFDTPISEITEGAENTRIVHHHDEIRLLDSYRSLSGDGRTHALQMVDTLAAQERTSDAETLVALPHYDYPVSAGPGSLLDGDGYELRQYPALMVPHGATFTLRVRGDSMTPLLEDDDVVFVSPADTLDNGDIGVIIINDEGYVKEFRDWVFVSKNPAYAPIRPSVFDSVQIVGKVLDKVWKK